MREALSIAEEKFQALIFWNPPPALPFRSPHTRCTPNKTGDTRQAWLKTLAQLEQQAGERQHIYQTLRYLSIPVVGTAAGCVSQFAFELLLHCDRVVAALECRLGFPKLFQGLFPAHGGCLEIARRAARDARHGDIFSLIKFYFDTLINSRTAANAHQARQWGLLTTADAIVLNPDELFHTASIHTQSMLQTGYRPPLREPVAIAGRAAAETLIKNRHTADNCSDRINGWREYHDQIADKLAYVLCGGDAGDCRYIEPGQMLRLEREAFSDIVRILTK
jgi:3-hydroxyacyl-CoA dehydrogenase